MELQVIAGEAIETDKRASFRQTIDQVYLRSKAD
jgi:hypothetical protein